MKWFATSLIVLLAASCQGDIANLSIQNEIDQRIAWGYNHHITAAIISPEGITSFHGGHFPCHPEDAIFEIGSVTKLLTAHLVFTFVSKGLLSINTPISAYLPNSWKISASQQHKITLKDLLSHSSGIQDPPSHNYLNPLTGNTVIAAEFSQQDLREYLEKTPLLNEPGTALAYSNLGYALIGCILETVSQQSFDELLQQYICGPLSMTSTSVALSTEQLSNRVAGNASGFPAPHWSPALPAFASVSSTLTDMARYAQYLFFSEAEAARMIRENIFRPILPFAALPIESTCGLTIDKRYGGKIYAAAGRTLGFSSFIGACLDTKRAVVLLTDASTLDNLGHKWLNQNFPQQQLHMPIALEEGFLKQYEGQYVSLGDIPPIFLVAQAGWIELHCEGELPIELFPFSPYAFFSKNLEIADTIVEINTSKGIPISLTIVTPEQKLRFSKISSK